MPASAIIRTEGLTRTFGDVRAVDGLDLEIPAGTVFGFLGPNGAGKTTTIRLLLGLLEPTGGRATVLGFDTRSDAASVRERSGALLEHHGLYERLSAEENLAFYARVWHMGRAARADRIRALLEPLEPLGSPRRAGRALEPRDEAEAGRGARAAAQAQPAVPRRAHGRPRSRGGGHAAGRTGHAGAGARASPCS